MARKPQEDLIFPQIFHCNICNVENGYFLIIKSFGQAVWSGTVCDYTHKNKIGKEINREEAKHFLESEKREVEILCAQATNETRMNLLEYVSKINAALSRIHRR